MFSLLLFPVQVMAQQARAGKRYLRAFVSGFFVAVPVTVTVLDRLACVARVEGASMQVSLKRRQHGASLLPRYVRVQREGWQNVLRTKSCSFLPAKVSKRRK